MTSDGTLKIMDFGIALDESARRLTWSGLSSTIGTPDYMAPEQVSGRRGDVRTDIYAMGTILYEMLTGELPYAGSSNVYAMMKAKTTEDPATPDRAIVPTSIRISRKSSCTRSSAPRAIATQTAAEMLKDLQDPSQVEIHNRAQPLHPTSLQEVGRCGAAVGVGAVLRLVDRGVRCF